MYGVFYLLKRAYPPENSCVVPNLITVFFTEMTSLPFLLFLARVRVKSLIFGDTSLILFIFSEFCIHSGSIVQNQTRYFL